MLKLFQPKLTIAVFTNCIYQLDQKSVKTKDFVKGFIKMLSDAQRAQGQHSGPLSGIHTNNTHTK